MSRTHLLVAAVLCAAAGLAFVSNCGDGERAPTPRADSAQRRERIEITKRFPPDSPADDIRNSRASVSRIVSGLNDAVTAPFPGRLELDLPATRRGLVRGVLVPRGNAAGPHAAAHPPELRDRLRRRQEG
jgi:hypothetical protein